MKQKVNKVKVIFLSSLQWDWKRTTVSKGSQFDHSHHGEAVGFKMKLSKIAVLLDMLPMILCSAEQNPQHKPPCLRC